MRGGGFGRFALVPVDREAVLLDSQTGDIFTLNQTAARIWEEHLQGESALSVANRLSTSFMIPAAQALVDVEATLDLGRLPRFPPPVSWCRFEASSQDFVLTLDGNELLYMNTGARTIRLARNTHRAPENLVELIAPCAPRLADLLGIHVIHASAVAVAKGAWLFCGDSGAGKTTIARALGMAGAIAISEDKVVLEKNARGEIVVREDGERTIRDWIGEAADRLRSAPTEPVSFSQLGDARAGAHREVRRVDFLDAQKRYPGSVFIETQVSASEACVRLVQACFVGSHDRTRWLAHVEMARGILRHPVCELACPEGLASIQSAATSLLERTARRL